MYLAEDRILCFELLVKKGKGRLMHYCKEAVAYTDVPPDLTALIKQRRRWLNGSFFANLYALRHCPRLFTESGHAAWRIACKTQELSVFLFAKYLALTELMRVSWY